MGSSKNILLGTIGYHLLANHSVGPILFNAINLQPWAERIEIQEMNWGPIAIVQQFETLKRPFDRVIFFTAIERHNRNIGDFQIYRWGGRLPSDEDIQACIGDAVTGVISSENLLIIGEHFGIWPKEVYLFDVEPGPEKAGVNLSPVLESRVEEYLEQLGLLCLHGEAYNGQVGWLYGSEIMEKNTTK